MLQSLGHSPLHLSSPSPSPCQNSFQNPKNSSSAINPRFPTKHPTILDEDSYVEALKKIIECDYFPNISKLRDRLDWLEAIKTGDPVQIHDAQLNIIERRDGRKDNKDLYAEEATAQKERERQRMLSIPGLISPSELQDEMVDS